jgi:hypothetical protein
MIAVFHVPSSMLQHESGSGDAGLKPCSYEER